MQLTGSQLDTLKTWLTANASGLNDEQAAAALNALVASPTWCWRTSVSESEFTKATGVDVDNANAATNWSWTGTGFIGRSQGERDCWARLFAKGSVNPSLANVRTAFSDIISGSTAPAPANRNHLLCIAKRQLTIGENLFSSGTGTFASPKTLAFGLGNVVDEVYAEGLITATNVSEARNRP